MQRLKEKTDNIHAFIQLVESLQVDRLDISEYNKIYFANHRKNLMYSVQLGLQILELCIKKTDKPLNYLSVAEIGGGTGLISLLAKWLGFGKVVYSDTYETSCLDFAVISKALNLEPDAIVTGSIQELGKQFHRKMDFLVSRDVIEHIYDLGEFFQATQTLFPLAVSVHNTSANYYNVFKKKYFKSIQEKDEWHGNPDQFKPGDSKKSFYQLRLEYIEKNYPHLSRSRKDILAIVTRGLVYKDIDKAVKKYIETELLPRRPIHPTNTCDPETGNWTEQLLSLEQYESFVDQTRFKVNWEFAPYDEWGNKGIKKFVQLVFNRIRNLSGKMAVYYVPAIVMVVEPVRE